MYGSAGLPTVRSLSPTGAETAEAGRRLLATTRKLCHTSFLKSLNFACDIRAYYDYDKAMWHRGPRM